MLGIVLFVIFFAVFVVTLAAHRSAWVREGTFGAYRDGNKRQIVENAICYGIASGLLLLLYAITSNMDGVMQPELNLALAASFFGLSGAMSFVAITRKASAPALVSA